MFASMGSLAAKTIAVVILILVVVLGASTGWQWKEKEWMLLGKLHEEAKNLNVVLVSALHNAMLQADMEGLERMINKVGRTETFRRVYVVDAAGKLFKSSDKTWVEDQEVIRAINAMRKSKQGSFALRKTAKGVPFMMGLSPIVAEKACTQCHQVEEGTAIGYMGLDRWAKQDFQQLRSSLRNTVVVNIAIIAVLLVALIVVTRCITRPLGEMAETANKIAKGDIDQTVTYDSSDEIGVLARAFRGMIDYIKDMSTAAEALSRGDLTVRVVARSEKDTLSHNFLRATEALHGLSDETQMLIRSTREGRLDVRGNAGKFEGTYADLINGINEMTDAVMAPISEAAAVLDQVAARDLRCRMQAEYKGDYQQIKTALNMAIANLEEGLSQVAMSAEQVAAAASQINAGSQSLAQGASSQSGTIEEVSSSLQEMTSISVQNTDSAQEARSLSECARQSAEKGMESMQRLSQAVERIKTSADETAKIVRTIDEIAFQTNLLALNAAVEAARAGDAGKGFAVVAEEVRSLAMRSAEAAKNTARMIAQSLHNVEDGVSLNQEVLTKLEEINGQVEKVSAVMVEIVAASDRQSQQIEQVSTAVEQVSDVTEQNAANSEESASAAEELSGQAEAMRSLVATFRLTHARDSSTSAGGRLASRSVLA